MKNLGIDLTMYESALSDYLSMDIHSLTNPNLLLYFHLFKVFTVYKGFMV